VKLANPELEHLIEAEEKAFTLLTAIEERGLLRAGITEKEIGSEIFDLAREMFGVEKYWHKRIVRSGKNTLCPYDENPPDLLVNEGDILFLDLGPVFEDFEADVGRTYVLGDDPVKHKIKNDLEKAWYEIRDWFFEHDRLTGRECFEYAERTAEKYGWKYGIEIAGHLVGKFPHERLPKGQKGLYLHKDNPNDVFAPAADGTQRNWILELQFIDPERGFGSFFEQLLR
jgi:Xaa-Pro aminopeptidase